MSIVKMTNSLDDILESLREKFVREFEQEIFERMKNPEEILRSPQYVQLLERRMKEGA